MILGDIGDLGGPTRREVYRFATTAQRVVYTGNKGELIYDTDLDGLYVMNGSVAGGIPVLNAGIVTDTTTARVAVIGDASAVLVELENASATTYTINQSIFAVGASIDFAQTGAGQVTVVAGSGITIRTAETLLLRKQYSCANLTQLATDEFILAGDLEIA